MAQQFRNFALCTFNFKLLYVPVSTSCLIDQIHTFRTFLAARFHLCLSLGERNPVLFILITGYPNLIHLVAAVGCAELICVHSQLSTLY